MKNNPTKGEHSNNFWRKYRKQRKAYNKARKQAVRRNKRN